MKENQKSNKSFLFVEVAESTEIYPYISRFSIYLNNET